jgi:hypothetical protein
VKIPVTTSANQKTLIMIARCALRRPRRAAITPLISATVVEIDRPWIQLNCPITGYFADEERRDRDEKHQRNPSVAQPAIKDRPGAGRELYRPEKKRPGSCQRVKLNGWVGRKKRLDVHWTRLSQRCNDYLHRILAKCSCFCQHEEHQFFGDKGGGIDPLAKSRRRTRAKSGCFRKKKAALRGRSPGRKRPMKGMERRITPLPQDQCKFTAPCPQAFDAQYPPASRMWLNFLAICCAIAS